MKQGLMSRVTSGGLPVLHLHYAADPEKDPATDRGRKWLESELNGYPGGVMNSDWLKEMEIQWMAGGGDRIFPSWSKWQTDSNIIISPDVDVSEAKLYASYDHGYANPACYLIHAVYPDGLRRTIWEFYASEVHPIKIAEIIKGNDVTLEDGRHFPGNPYAGREIIRLADPEIDRRTQALHTGEFKSVIEMYRQSGVYFQKGRRGGDATVASWLSGNLWADPYQPGYQITSTCLYLIWEIGRLQRIKLSSLMGQKRNPSEQFVDKDNHAWDALKYWLLRFPVGAKAQVETEKVANFEWWRDLHAKKRRNGVLPSYRREFVG
jgi:hypothetical protein